MGTPTVNEGYLSGEAHEACGWMAVEGWIRGGCACPSASPCFAFPVQGLLPSFDLGSLNGGGTRIPWWISSALCFLSLCIPLCGERDVEKLGRGSGYSRMVGVFSVARAFSARALNPSPCFVLLSPTTLCFDRAFSRVLLLRISCTRLFEPHATHPRYAQAGKRERPRID